MSDWHIDAGITLVLVTECLSLGLFECQKLMLMLLYKLAACFLISVDIFTDTKVFKRLYIQVGVVQLAKEV